MENGGVEKVEESAPTVVDAYPALISPKNGLDVPNEEDSEKKVTPESAMSSSSSSRPSTIPFPFGNIQTNMVRVTSRRTSENSSSLQSPRSNRGEEPLRDASESPQNNNDGGTTTNNEPSSQQQGTYFPGVAHMVYPISATQRYKRLKRNQEFSLYGIHITFIGTSQNTDNCWHCNFCNTGFPTRTGLQR